LFLQNFKLSPLPAFCFLGSKIARVSLAFQEIDVQWTLFTELDGIGEEHPCETKAEALETAKERKRMGARLLALKDGNDVVMNETQLEEYCQFGS
jgi:hypothetical protein